MLSDTICINYEPFKLEENFFGNYLKSQDKSIFQLKNANKDSLYSSETKILISSKSKEIVFDKSFLVPHYLKADKIQINTPIVKSHYDFATMIVFFVFLLFVLLKVMFNKRLKQITDVFFAQRYLNLIIREGNIFTEQISIFLNFMYFPIISLFAYFFVQWVGNSNKIFILEFNTLHYSLFLGGFILYFFLKNFFIYGVGIIFDNKKAAYDYQVNLYIFNMLSGFIVFPLLTIFLYNPTPLSISIALILYGLLYFYKIYRSFLIGLSNSNYPLYYLFLYLCTVEFLPVFIATKLVIKYL